MPDDFVTVHRSHDPVEVEIACDLLQEGGVDHRVLGGRALDAAAWGAEARVDVRASDVARARRLLEAHLGETPPELDGDEPASTFQKRISPLFRVAVMLLGLVTLVAAGASLFGRRHQPARRSFMGDEDSVRSSAQDPRQLPFPLHLEIGR